jgi:multiple antibiotic resistance protein
MKHQLAVYANAVLFTLAALLPIVNPLGSAPIFLSLSADLPPAARHRLAASVGRHAFILLAAAMLIGSYVLRLFGVSLPIVRVGGGLLVTASGWRLLNDVRRRRPTALKHSGVRAGTRPNCWPTWRESA